MLFSLLKFASFEFITHRELRIDALFEYPTGLGLLITPLCPPSGNTDRWGSMSRGGKLSPSDTVLMPDQNLPSSAILANMFPFPIYQYSLKELSVRNERIELPTCRLPGLFAGTTAALSTELIALARPEGIEPPSSAFGVRCLTTWLRAYGI